MELDSINFFSQAKTSEFHQYPTVLRKQFRGEDSVANCAQIEDQYEAQEGR
jgi:hypothetical protein